MKMNSEGVDTKKRSVALGSLGLMGVLSLLHLIGLILIGIGSSSDDSTLHGLGNMLYNNILFRLMQVLAFILVVLFIYQRFHPLVIGIPLCFALLGIPFLALFNLFSTPISPVRDAIEGIEHLLVIAGVISVFLMHQRFLPLEGEA